MRDQFGRLAGPNARDAALGHTAGVLRPVGHDHEPVAARLRDDLRLRELPVAGKGQHLVVTVVDDDDVAFRVDTDAVGLVQRVPLHENRGRATGLNLPDPPRRRIRVLPQIARLRDVDRSVLRDLEVIAPSRVLDANLADGWAGPQVKLPNDGHAQVVLAPPAILISLVKGPAGDVAARRMAQRERRGHGPLGGGLHAAVRLTRQPVSERPDHWHRWPTYG